MKKYFVLASLVLSLAFGGVGFHQAQAASVREGWIESTNWWIQGWAYDNNKTVYAKVVLQDINNPGKSYTIQFDNVNGVTDQYSWSYRLDVVSYLTQKYGNLSFGPSNGFQVDIHQYVPIGTYRIKSATFNGKSFSLTGAARKPFSVTTSNLPAVASKPVAAPYFAEGWLESVSNNISGWAYDNGNPVTVTITVENVKTGTLQTITAYPQDIRQDVSAYVVSKIGATPAAGTGFKADYYSLPAGTYRIKYATYNGRSFNVSTNANYNFTTGVDHKVRLTSPNGGEQWMQNGYQTITWVDANPTGDTNQTYTLWLTGLNGGSYGEIATVSNVHQYTWKVGNFVDGSAIANGSYYIQIQKQYVDGNGTWDQTDNAFSIVGQPLPVSGLPDFVLGSLTYNPGFVYTNQPITVKATLYNNGTATANVPGWTYGYGGNPLNSSSSSGDCSARTLAPGEYCTIYITYWYDTPGDKSVTLTVNPAGNSGWVAESNANNNSLTVNFHVY